MTVPSTVATNQVIEFDEVENGKRKFVCKTCSRSFKRSEHCARHQRGHTQEKPYACRYCRKNYSRKDLVVRHERTLHAEEHERHRQSAPIPGAKVAKRGSVLGTADDESSIASDEEQQLRNGDYIELRDDLVHESLDPASIDEDTIDVAVPRRRSEQQDARNSINPNISSGSHDLLTISAPELVMEGISNTAGAQIFQHSSSISIGALNPSHDVPVLNEPSFSLIPSMQEQSNDFTLPDITTFDDMELPGLDFFDPFLGSTFEGFVVPNMPDAFTNFSPLESISAPMLQVNGNESPGLFRSTSIGNDGVRPADINPGSPKQVSRTVARSVTSNSTSSSRMPQVTKSPVVKQPSITFTEPMRVNMLVDLRHRLDGATYTSFVLPSASAMQKCLRTYVEAFHIHLPLLHLQSLDFMRTPSPLILAMASIGALYRLERSVANQLFIKAVQALNNQDLNLIHLLETPGFEKGWREPQDVPVSKHNRSLWMSQTRFLTIFYSSFSGEPLLVKKSLEDLGYLSTEYRDRLSSVMAGSSDKRELDWSAWVERESTKRLLYGILMLSNLLTITYGVPPAFSMTQDGIIEMPDDEALWDASTAGQWHSIANMRPNMSCWTLKEALTALMYGNIQDDLSEHYWKWSSFATAVIMHSVSISIWFALFSTSLFDTDNSSSPGPVSGVRTMSKTTEAALNRCRDLLVQARSDDPLWAETEGPLLFNAFAVLRVSYGRAFTSVRLVDRMMLLKEDRQDILAAVRAYVDVQQERNEFTTRAVSRALEGFAIPFKSGALLVRKTAALTWSIEHALAGWDAALLVSKWTYSIQHTQKTGAMTTPSEQVVYQEVHSILQEGNVVGTELDPKRSLAADLTRLWAEFYDDTWVWGVTPRIGWVLRALADEYQARWANSD